MCLRNVSHRSKQGNVSHTDAYDQRADSEAGYGVFDQVRRSGSQQGRRCPHAVVIVGGLEGFAVGISIHPLRFHTARLTIPCWRAETLTALRGIANVSPRW